MIKICSIFIVLFSTANTRLICVIFVITEHCRLCLRVHRFLLFAIHNFGHLQYEYDVFISLWFYLLNEVHNEWRFPENKSNSSFRFHIFWKSVFRDEFIADLKLHVASAFLLSVFVTKLFIHKCLFGILWRVCIRISHYLFSMFCLSIFSKYSPASPATLTETGMIYLYFM